MSNQPNAATAASGSIATIRRTTPPADVTNLNAYYDLLDVTIVLVFGLGPVFISPRTGTLFMFAERRQHWRIIKELCGPE